MSHPKSYNFVIFVGHKSTFYLATPPYLPNRKAIAEFTRLQNKLFDLLFRQQYWQNLICDRAWIDGFYSLLKDLPTAETLKSDRFCRDFRTVFYPKVRAMTQEKIDEPKHKSEIDYS